MSRRCALGILVALLGGVVLLVVARGSWWTNLDPDPEFGVIMVNPCPSAVEFLVSAEPTSGGSGRDEAITIEAESIVELTWGVFEGDLVVSAPSLAWVRRMNAPARYQSVDFLLEAESCP